MAPKLRQIEHQEHAPSDHHGRSLAVALLDLKDPLNVGQAFRLASAMGIEMLYLLGQTPHPPSAKITRTARGAEQEMKWEHSSWEDFAARMKQEGRAVIALEYAHGAQRLELISRQWRDKPCVLLVGNEQAGLPASVLAACDAVAQIPMHGRLSSINVASALGIGMWEWVRDSSR